MGPGPITQELIERKTWIRWFWDVMNYQLFEVDGHPFSASKVVIGVVLLGVGYWVARRASQTVERRLLIRLEMEASLRYAMGRFTFYLFLIIAWLFILHILNVPITIFAVVGSALAIGVGFGSQNIIYNFISGLVVMVERPVRVGDFIEIDSVAGTIQSIGIRSSLILTPGNARVIVPNTYFLEKTVVNWTLGDDLQTGKVSVGVAYDTDLKALDRVCKEAAEGITGMLSSQPVTLTFRDFGDNALLIDIGFWCRARSTGARKGIESDYRFRLFDLLKAANISMPYPQREMHLSAEKPIEVSVVSNRVAERI